MSAPFRIDLRDVSTLPTRRDEAWRWTDLRRAVGEPVAPAPEIAPPYAPGPFAHVAGDETVFANGRLARGGSLARLRLGDGAHRLRFVIDAADGGWQAGVDVVVEAGASATLLESYQGQGRYIGHATLAISLEPGAALERIVLMDEDEDADAVSVSTAAVSLGAGARFRQTVVTTGARLQRHETQLVHPGKGVEARLDGLYLLDGARHADLTTVVDHTGGGVTLQMCKGVAAGRARAVFQGRITVRRGADGTDARMRHDALLLGDLAEVDAKPELEIYADDVACAHGNTVGALDDEALFYIRSRGVPEAEARTLLMQAFVGEVVARIEHEGAREIVAAFVAERLEALS